MKGIPEQSNATLQNSESEPFPYLEACQLSSPPFSSDIEASSAYLDEEWQQNLDQLTHLVQSSDLLLAVSAEEGMGKTTLAKLFIQQANRHIRCCPVTVTSALDEQGFLQALSSCLDLPDQISEQARLELLIETGRDLQRNDIIPVILLDNAQDLPDETLQLLLQLYSNKDTDPDEQGSAWRILLFTTPALTTKLIQLQSHLHVVQLVPLNKDSLGQYLLHHLKQVGLKQASPFSEKDINFIFQHSHGNFNQINLLAHQVLLKKYTRINKPMNTKSQDKKSLAQQPGVWVALAIVILLSAVLFFQTKINQLVEPETNNESILAQTSFDLPTTKEYLLKKMPDIPRPPAQAYIVDKQAPVLEDMGAAKTAPIDSTHDDEIKNAVQSEAPKPVEIISEQEPKAIAAVDKPGIPTEVPANNTTTETDTLKSLLAKHKIQDKTWIMQQPASSLSAQMMASSKPDALIRQARKPALQGRTAIYRILRKNQDWYVMIFGSYKDKTSLRKAVDKLPAALRKGKPWIRSMSAIQAEIKAGKK